MKKDWHNKAWERDALGVLRFIFIFRVRHQTWLSYFLVLAAPPHERSAKITMSKGKIDLRASTLGERWFQFAVNHASGIWFSVFSLAIGVLFTLLYNVFPSRDPGLSIYLGPLWIASALVHFERHHARKAIERLIADRVTASGESLPTENQEAEQDGEPDAPRS